MPDDESSYKMARGSNKMVVRIYSSNLMKDFQLAESLLNSSKTRKIRRDFKSI